MFPIGGVSGKLGGRFAADKIAFGVPTGTMGEAIVIGSGFDSSAGAVGTATGSLAEALGSAFDALGAPQLVKAMEATAAR